MKRYMYIGSILMLMVCAFNAQAYTFTIKNFTDNQRTVAIQLKGASKPLEEQTIEPYGTQPGFFAQAKAKIKGAAKSISTALSALHQDWSNKLNQLSQEIGITDKDTLEKNLNDLRKNIEEQMQKGALKIGAKKWVNDLYTLQTDVKKGFNNLDKNQLAKKLAQLQTDMSQKWDQVSSEMEEEQITELDTAVFTVGGLKMGLCVSKILVDGASVKIYGVSPKEYADLQNKFASNKQAFINTLKNNRSRYTDMSSSLFGVCFNRQFDIIELDGGELVAITKELL